SAGSLNMPRLWPMPEAGFFMAGPRRSRHHPLRGRGKAGIAMKPKRCFGVWPWRLGERRCNMARHSPGFQRSQHKGNAMIRSELIQKISEENPHLFRRDIERIVNTVFEEIIDAMARGDRVELRGFGAF